MYSPPPPMPFTIVETIGDNIRHSSMASSLDTLSPAEKTSKGRRRQRSNSRFRYRLRLGRITDGHMHGFVAAPMPSRRQQRFRRCTQVKAQYWQPSPPSVLRRRMAAYRNAAVADFVASRSGRNRSLHLPRSHVTIAKSRISAGAEILSRRKPAFPCLTRPIISYVTMMF